MIRRALLVLSIVSIGLAGVASAAGIPPAPAGSHFIQDYAGVVPEETRLQIGRVQERAFNADDTPIMVVTIPSMADYGPADAAIEDFARSWFDAWQIGKRTPDGTLVNRGMLLLVSVGDRKARIELGADWGHAADRRAAHIMDSTIIPSFRQRAFAEGIHDGVVSLASLAAAGPGSVAEDKGVQEDTAADWIGRATGSREVTTSPMPMQLILAVSALGVMLIALAFVFPSHRKLLLASGIALIAAAWLFWLILLALAVFSSVKNRSRGGFSGGGFSSRGGFGTGGFSRGGGASGSW